MTRTTATTEPAPGARPLTRRHLGLGLLTAVVLSGCSVGTGSPSGDGEEEPAQDPPAGQGDSPASDGQDDGSAGDEDATQGTDGDATAVHDEDAASAGVDLTDAGDPVFEATVPATVEGDPEASMTVALHSLERRDETVVAIFSFLVLSSEQSDPTDLYNYLGKSGWHPYAIDTVNLNRHGVMGSISSRTQTSYQGTRFAPGQTMYAYAMFAAPPEDVTTMDVSLVDGAPLATAVEIR